MDLTALLPWSWTLGMRASLRVADHISAVARVSGAITARRVRDGS